MIGPVSASNGTPVGLIMLGTYGPKVYNTVFDAGVAHFVIPSKDTRQPGYLALIAAAEDARGEASIILLSEGTASASEISDVVSYGEGVEASAGVSTPPSAGTP
ncbi:MAG: hypothetical protein OHK0046_21180 [Anaerolineae bacterium]